MSDAVSVIGLACRLHAYRTIRAAPHLFLGAEVTGAAAPAKSEAQPPFAGLGWLGLGGALTPSAAAGGGAGWVAVASMGLAVTAGVDALTALAALPTNCEGIHVELISNESSYRRLPCRLLRALPTETTFSLAASSADASASERSPN